MKKWFLKWIGMESVWADLMAIRDRIESLKVMREAWAAELADVQRENAELIARCQKMEDRLLAMERRAEDRARTVSGMAGLRNAIAEQGGLKDGLNTRVVGR